MAELRAMGVCSDDNILNLSRQCLGCFDLKRWEDVYNVSHSYSEHTCHQIKKVKCCMLIRVSYCLIYLADRRGEGWAPIFEKEISKNTKEIHRQEKICFCWPFSRGTVCCGKTVWWVCLSMSSNEKWVHVVACYLCNCNTCHLDFWN